MSLRCTGLNYPLFPTSPLLTYTGPQAGEAYAREPYEQPFDQAFAAPLYGFEAFWIRRSGPLNLALNGVRGLLLGTTPPMNRIRVAKACIYKRDSACHMLSISVLVRYRGL